MKNGPNGKESSGLLTYQLMPCMQDASIPAGILTAVVQLIGLAPGFTSTFIWATAAKETTESLETSNPSE